MKRPLASIAILLAACGGPDFADENLAATADQSVLQEMHALAIYEITSPGVFAIVCQGQIALSAQGNSASGTWNCAQSRNQSTGALIGNQSGTISGTIDGENLSLSLDGGTSAIQVSAHVVTTGSLHRLDGTAQMDGASHLFQAWDGQDVMR